jgi:hypothetical protein
VGDVTDDCFVHLCYTDLVKEEGKSVYLDEIGDEFALIGNSEEDVFMSIGEALLYLTMYYEDSGFKFI